MKKIYLLAVLQLLLIIPVVAQTFNGTTNAWETAGNWSWPAGSTQSGVPTGASTDVWINKHVVSSQSSNITIGTVDVKTGSNITVGGCSSSTSCGGTFTIGSEALFKATTPIKENLIFDNQSDLNVYGTLEIWGDLIIKNGMTLNLYGTMIVHGNVIMQNNGTLTITGSGSLIVDGDFSAKGKLAMTNDGNVSVGGSSSIFRRSKSLS